MFITVTVLNAITPHEKGVCFKSQWELFTRDTELEITELDRLICDVNDFWQCD